jgi:hypothetical protein
MNQPKTMRRRKKMEKRRRRPCGISIIVTRNAVLERNSRDIV